MPPTSHWRRIARDEVDGWNARLLGTDASLFQLPYWNEPLRAMRFVPKYLVYEVGGVQAAYVCLLSLGVPGVRIGLVQQGPVGLNGSAPSSAAIAELARWARRRGYWFLRFTHSDKDLLESIAALPAAHRTDAFPFYRQPGTELRVPQEGSDAEVLARFQEVARRGIRKGAAEGFRIEWSSDPDELRKAWPLFQRLAVRKGFNYRPLESYVAMLRAAAPHGGARVYTAWLEDTLVEAIVVVRDGDTAHYVSGALDLGALGSHFSPSTLIHWRAMRDFAAESVRWYNLGSRSGSVYTFKRKFHPLEVDHPDPVTLVTNRPLFTLWSMVGLPFVTSHWRGLKRVVARVLGGRRAASARSS